MAKKNSLTTAAIESCSVKWGITWKDLHSLYLNYCGKEISQAELVEAVFPIVLKADLRSSPSISRLFTTNGCGPFGKILKALAEATNPANERYTREEDHKIIAGFREGWRTLLGMPSVEQCKYLTTELNRILSLCKESIYEQEIKQRFDDALTEIASTTYGTVEPLLDALGLLSVIASTLYTTNGYVWMQPAQIQSGAGEEDAPMSRDETKNAKRLRALISHTLTISAPEAIKTARSALAHEGVLGLKDLKAIEELLDPLLKADKEDKDFGPEAHYLRYRAYMKAKTHESKAKNDLISSANAGWQEAQAVYGEQLYKEAESLKDKKGQLHNCVRKLETILSLHHSSNSARGQAFFLLYKLKKQYPAETTLANYDLMELLGRSRKLGFLDAGKEWLRIEQERPIKPDYSDILAETRIMWFVNDEESLAVKVFKESIKRIESFTCKPVLDFDLAAADFQNSRFLFISDDCKKNLRDVLDFLQTLQDKLADSQIPRIFLRSDSEITASVIDTALSHLPVLCDVRIINDSQFAAQQLLTRHPLFYSLLQSDIKQNQATQTMEFVIMGTTPVAEWLCRESFWMLGFCDKSRITIVAPEAEAFVTRIKAQNPGMTTGKVKIKGIPLAEVRSKNTSYDQVEFMDVIQSIRNEKNTRLYFAVAVGSDEENLSLARWIRTGLIRNAIAKGSNASLHIQEPIAVYCEDPYLNLLFRNTVVESVAYGDSWFNTWALIPFGGIVDTYRWDRMEYDSFELMSKCVHLDYSGVNPSKTNQNLHQENENALRDYYRRQYNRDSSYAIALSMPYRLFQFENKIVPPYWDILDRNAWTSQKATDELTELLPDGLSKVDPGLIKPLSVFRSKKSQEFRDEELKMQMEELEEKRSSLVKDVLAVAEWEHARWTRWMLSRGWMPATPEEAVFSVKENNPRQQLFVARLHPCICAFAFLDTLATVLYDKCGIAKEFYQYDARNVIDTGAILKLEWFQDNSEKLESVQEARNNE